MEHISICSAYFRYELYDPCTVMFFFRNRHMMIDLGTGNNNKINWPLRDEQEMIDIIETVYRGARKGRGLVMSPKDYSTKYKYWIERDLTERIACSIEIVLISNRPTIASMLMIIEIKIYLNSKYKIYSIS